MKSKLAICCAMTLLSGVAFGTVALNFSVDFAGGVPQGFSDTEGTPTNGMIWGILIDGSGNGISSSYEALTTAIVTSQDYILSTSGVVTDDVLWTSKTLTVSTASSTELDGVTVGGNGGIYDIKSIGLTNGVNAGDKFYVVWFSGTKGGVLGDPSFIIPSEGSTSDFGNPFVGVDPNRTAGLAYSGTSGESTGAGFTLSLVPEPSSLIFGALGVLGFLRRRRN